MVSLSNRKTGRGTEEMQGHQLGGCCGSWGQRKGCLSLGQCESGGGMWLAVTGERLGQAHGEGRGRQEAWRVLDLTCMIMILADT